MDELNYGVSEFLGIVLIFFPAIIYLTSVIQKGLYSLIQDFFKEDDEEDEERTFFHHHFHYKDKRR